MRLYAWVTILLLLVFGIGWTARLLAERAAPVADQETIGPADWPDATRARHGRRGGGPFMGTIELCAKELELSEEQLAEMDRIMHETMEEIRGHEQKIWDVKQRTRPKILAVLTDAQRDRLEELIEVRMAERREQKLASTMAWLSDTADLDEASTAAVQSILVDYEGGKEEFFLGLAEQNTFPEELDVENELERLRQKRDEALSQYLDEGTLSQMRGRHRRHRK